VHEDVIARDVDRAGRLIHRRRVLALDVLVASWKSGMVRSPSSVFMKKGW
jgi:hypothetical protein